MPIDNTQISRIFYFILFSIITAVGLASLLRFKIKKVTTAIAIAIFAQSIFIIIDYNSISFHHFVSNSLVQSERYREDWIRAVGLTNGGGSSLGIIQFSGFVITLYLVKLSKTKRQTYLYIFMSVVIVFSTLLTGRTGVVMEAIFLFLYPLTSGKNSLSKIKSYFISIIVIMLVLYILDKFLINYMLETNTKFEFLLSWLEELLGFFNQEGVATISTLESMNIPPISIDTIFGTGLVANPDGSNASGSDIGYIQTYYALGLIMTVVFYVSLFTYLSTSFYRYFGKDYLFWQLFVILVFASEYKEPFIFKYSLMFVIFSILACKFEFYKRRKYGGKFEI